MVLSAILKIGRPQSMVLSVHLASRVGILVRNYTILYKNHGNRTYLDPFRDNLDSSANRLAYRSSYLVHGIGMREPPFPPLIRYI